MFLSLPELQKERGFPHPSRKKKLLKLKRESCIYPLCIAGRAMAQACPDDVRSGEPCHAAPPRTGRCTAPPPAMRKGSAFPRGGHPKQPPPCRLGGWASQPAGRKI